MTSRTDSRVEELPADECWALLRNEVVGRLGLLQQGGFLLVSEKRDHSQRPLRFDEVQSVKTKMTAATKWKIGIIIWAPLLIGSLILGK